MNAVRAGALSVAAVAAVAAAPPHRGPDRIGAHLLLALAVFAVAALAFYGMWRGWRRRVRHGHPDLPPLPQPPLRDERGRVLVPPVSGLYVGTVTAEDWLDRVAAEGLSLRATGRLQVTERGAIIERDGGAPVWLPVAALRSVRIAEALAGHVMGPAGLLVIGWRHGPYELESGFRADDRDAYPPLIAALRAMLPADAAAAPQADAAAAPQADAPPTPQADGPVAAQADGAAAPQADGPVAPQADGPPQLPEAPYPQDAEPAAGSRAAARRPAKGRHR